MGSSALRRTSAWLLGIALLAAAPASAKEKEPHNGFSLAGAVVAPEEILGGGPAKDGIRSIDAPAFVPPEEATWVHDSNPMLGVAQGAEARAYPVQLMEYHQVANDVIGGVPIAVTYDPIAGVPRAYKRKVGGRTLEFGVSGLVYRANFLLYDRQTQSLWSQYLGRAVAGPLAGTALEAVGIRQEPLAVWLTRHATTGVLVRPAPKHIDYRHSRFTAYWGSPRVPFPVPHSDDRFHPKEVTIGVEVAGQSRAYLGSILLANGSRIVDELAGRKIRVAYDTNSATFQWEVPDDVKVTEAYWFAWKAFQPETSVWLPEGSEGAAEAGEVGAGGAPVPERPNR